MKSKLTLVGHGEGMAWVTSLPVRRRHWTKMLADEEQSGMLAGSAVVVIASRLWGRRLKRWIVDSVADWWILHSGCYQRSYQRWNWVRENCWSVAEEYKTDIGFAIADWTEESMLRGRQIHKLETDGAVVELVQRRKNAMDFRWWEKRFSDEIGEMRLGR